MGAISVDIGNAIPYFVDRFLEVVGRDPSSESLRRWFTELQSVGFLHASTVHCVGLHTPMSLSEMYQPLRLQWQSTEAHEGGQQVSLPNEPIEDNSLLEPPANAVILAGPGRGKTTVLKFVFLRSFESKKSIPVIIFLRHPKAADNLETLVDTLDRIPSVRRQQLPVLLLVDGYDEIARPARVQVSAALMRYMAMRRGKFLLTCRENYDIYDLPVPRASVLPFGEREQYNFVKNFCRAYTASLVPEAFISEMKLRGLDDFLEHPLLLGLACIVKAGHVPLHSRSILGLIERAIDTLTFRWDEGKGVARESQVPLDGRDRIKLLMRVAFEFKDGAGENEFLPTVRDQLKRLHCDNVDARSAMLEVAQFFGIFVPTGDSGMTGQTWTWAHKSIRDYLAAKYWIDANHFDARKVKEWDAAAAYAACLSIDATSALRSALAHSASLPAVIEMLSNDAAFDSRSIARAIVRFLQINSSLYEHHELYDSVNATLSRDFISVGPTQFLINLVDVCLRREKPLPEEEVCLAYALNELHVRGQCLPRATYGKLLQTYYSRSEFEFVTGESEDEQHRVAIRDC